MEGQVERTGQKMKGKKEKQKLTEGKKEKKDSIQNVDKDAE